MDLTFSLKEPLTCEKLCNSINQLVGKKIKTPEDAQDSLIVVSIVKIQSENEHYLEQKI